ncbi:hypothetical protein M1146_08225 [Patescibacteria group bacterium]|nr:hypothetical protein [Patescibacteria group bacterium]
MEGRQTAHNDFVITGRQTALNDFVIVGEFSEIEGPISRLVLPEEANANLIAAPFDVEAFVLKTMNVELNTDNQDWTTTMELEGGLCAFVQHISLLDLNARYCMGCACSRSKGVT